jgi:hypothetical protein
MTHHITPAGLAALRGRFGLRVVLDLRNAEELDLDGVAPFEDHGIAYYNAPVGGETVMTPEERSERMARIAGGEVDWGEMYVQMMSREGAAYRQLFELAASDETLPLVFHCTGGRDRTGIGAALLLSALGVSDEDIAADYALTGAFLRPHAGRFSRHREMFGMSGDQWMALIETTGEAMHQSLSHLRGEYGSTEGYLQSIGIAGETLLAVRTTLLER